MTIGKDKHERILKETINELREIGYKTICLDGKRPTAIAFNNIELIAVVINKKIKSKTNIFNTYYMFNRIIIKASSNVDKSLEQISKNLSGYRFIKLCDKCPDAIALKDNMIFAIEVLGLGKGCKGNKIKGNKISNYDMFDGVMIVSFWYDNDDVFTETFGSYKENNI